MNIMALTKIKLAKEVAIGGLDGGIGMLDAPATYPAGAKRPRRVDDLFSLESTVSTEFIADGLATDNS
mgnify:CR=1 FL=1